MTDVNPTTVVRLARKVIKLITSPEDPIARTMTKHFAEVIALLIEDGVTTRTREHVLRRMLYEISKRNLSWYAWNCIPRQNYKALKAFKIKNGAIIFPEIDRRLGP